MTATPYHPLARVTQTDAGHPTPTYDNNGNMTKPRIKGRKSITPNAAMPASAKSECSPDATAAFCANRAVTLGRLGRHVEAEAALRQALRLRPDDPMLLDTLGVALEHQERYNEAAAAFERAIALQPAHPIAHIHLSNVLRKSGRAEGADAAARRALQFTPESPEAHNSLGAALMEMNRVREGAESFRRALTLRPDFPDARLNLATATLAAGNLGEGFRAFECRVHHRLWKRDLPGMRWTLASGFDPAGKTVLVYSEGGLGNTIQFVRFASVLAGCGARVLLESPRPLLPLLSGVARVAELLPYGSALPAYDAYAGIMSLPALLGMTPESAATAFPYLNVQPERVERCGRALAQIAGRKVGICWHGDQRVACRRDRSFDPAYLLGLARIPEVQLVNLQHGVDPPPELPVLTMPGLGPHDMKLEDVTAVMKHLDLVITCDTSIAHLAGALGVPVWVALKHAACWRWMLDREDSPWYPTMRLFRQTKAGDWGGVFARMAECLKTRLSGSAAAAGWARAAMSD